MEKQGKKKEWVAPELLVLVRSHPEEAVLTACKLFGPNGPNNVNSTCSTDCAMACEVPAFS